MKTNRIIKNMAALALLATFNSQLSTAFAQGSLTPPGLPAPTMKSADQIYSKLDPRTPISTAPYTITNSGSYYLTANLTVSSGDAIDINTNGVTLDLNGFTISSTAASASGSGIWIIVVGGELNSSDFTIFNGHITGGFISGIGFTNIAPPGGTPGPLENVLVSKVSVSGVSGNGIYFCGPDPSMVGLSVVENCTVFHAGGRGIWASQVKNSTADSGLTAINGNLVTDCQGRSGSGYGIAATSAINCIGSSESGLGVSASATAQNCYGQSSATTGLLAQIAIGCVGSSYSGCGLWATIANSCIISHGTTNVTYHCNMPW